ncbi:MAG: DEAD/DEAH box helicase family protein [Verrucomicrobiae bacterium]|nr:DEAD/DEAH box helicase family protein [Verrucomicrobiae bacterium]
MKRSRHQAAQSDPSQFAPGQRWISETQPELGLALVVACDFSQVKVLYPAAGETLIYSSRSAPLRRVAFDPGDTIKNHSGETFLVDRIRVDEKRIVYIDADGKELPESELSDTMSVQKPEARILAAHIDEPNLWRLRQQALENRHMARAHNARGLTGGRISLIPHQLYIANEIASRVAPRVLLADEVGLGKTIEACLILHRLHLSGRAKRILILLPDALVNQWFVELFRRFQLSFSIYDEERAVSIESPSTSDDNELPDTGTKPPTNPFFDDQLVIVAMSWIADNPKRAAQAAEGKWDLVIVDEAHHIEWTPEQSSPGYEAVAAIAEKSPGLLLLTATPEQLGREGHFARLRLLDPDRFSDLNEFIEESNHYQEVSNLADRLRSGDDLSADESALLLKMLGQEAVDSLAEKNTLQNRAELTAQLVDLYGTGRVMFRNRRQVLEGFPKRIAHLWPLDVEHGTTDDSIGFEAKIDWLADVLTRMPEEKFLLICHTRELAERIEEALKDKISATAALFHEGLTLLQRDRNAAWFAESAEDGGARLLICSEIGSEGRNFQFAHHLALFDLPDDPALLEQRIGRLDRIGQTADIHIHVPYVPGSPEDLWAHWYHEGVGAFEHTLHGSAAIHRAFHDEITALAGTSVAKWEEALEDLKERTIAFKEKLYQELESGRDHLLEMSSFDRDLGERLVVEIEDLDLDWKLEKYMLRLFDHFGVTVEDLRDRQYLLKPEHLFSADVFPGLPEEGMSITFDRDQALAREELGFFTWDHPMVTSATEMLLASERGNAAFVYVAGARKQALLLEVVCVLECIAPEKLHADRFLPPQPLKVLVDHDGKDQSQSPESKLLGKGKAVPGPSGWLQKKAAPLKAMVPKILAAAEVIAEKQAVGLRETAADAMHEQLDAEIARLQKLREMGHPVPEAEIQALTEERDALDKHLREARLSVDSVRLVLAGV